MRRLRRVGRDERGAEVLEFALVFPLFAFLVFALMFSLLAVGAWVSLTHGALQGVRYASIPTDLLNGTYPTNAQVATRVSQSTPFFYSPACTTSTTGGVSENQPVSVAVTCSFFNPLGALVTNFGKMISHSIGGSSSSSSQVGGNLVITVTATARAE